MKFDLKGFYFYKILDFTACYVLANSVFMFIEFQLFIPPAILNSSLLNVFFSGQHFFYQLKTIIHFLKAVYAFIFFHV